MARVEGDGAYARLKYESGTHRVQRVPATEAQGRIHTSAATVAIIALEAGDFDCYSGCKLKVTIDGKTHSLPGSRPKTDDAIAMFVVDWKALWKLAKSGKQLSIEFPTKAVGKRSAEFEVGGLDAAKLPKWN